jgi:hypothetical protein
MHKKFYYIMIGLAFFVSYFGIFKNADALTGLLRTYDGGILLSPPIPCTCSGGFLIVMLSYIDFLPHSYLFIPGFTLLYQYFNIFVPSNAISSTHIPGGICLVIAGPTCVPLGITEGILTQIGTGGI